MGMKSEWVKHIEKWQGSGMSQAAYCRENQLNYHSFTVHLSAHRKLAKSVESESTAAPPPTLIPVEIECVSSLQIAASSICHDDERAAIPAAESVTLVFTHTQGHRLELPLSVSAGWVAELLRCLA